MTELSSLAVEKAAMKHVPFSDYCPVHIAQATNSQCCVHEAGYVLPTVEVRYQPCEQPLLTILKVA